MTPYEFSVYLQGRGEAADDTRQLNAQLAAWIMGPHCKKPVKPSHLLGKGRSFAGMTREEISEHYREKRTRARKGR